MVSHDSLVRAEKRLGVPAVIGRYHKAPERQLQDDYELGDKVRVGLMSVLRVEMKASFGGGPFFERNHLAG